MKEWIKKHKRNIFTFVAAFMILQFVGEWGYSTDGDAGQYMGMGGYLPPLYPLFLFVFRSIFGEAHYLAWTMVAQGLLGALGITMILDFMQKQYRLKKSVYLFFFVALFAPFVRESMREAPHMMYSHLILTEAISIPLFYCYIWSGLKTIKEKNIQWFLVMNLFSVLLICSRAQFQVCIPFNICVLMYLIFVQKKARVLFLCKGLILIIAAYMVSGVIEDSYKMARLGTTENAWNSSYFLLHCMYASDEEDVELYEDEDLRELYSILYQQLDEISYNYKYLDGGIYDKSEHWSVGFSDIYRGLKETVSIYVTEQGITAEIEQNERITEYVDGLMKPLLVKNGIRSFGYSLYQFPISMCSSVFVLKDNYLWFSYTGTMVIYLLTAIVTILRWRQNHYSFAVWFMLFILTFMIGNALVVGYVLHTQARYLLYSMGIFYVALGAVCLELWEHKKHQTVSVL